MATKPLTGDALVALIVDALSDKKAEDIVVMNVQKASSIADYFVIATGTVDRHVKALADEVEEQIKKKQGAQLIRTEGMGERQWVILDYGDVLVHLFTPQEREIFRLEDLWRPQRKEQPKEE